MNCKCLAVTLCHGAWLALLFTATSAHASDGLTNSYCTNSSLAQGNVLWRVDDKFAQAIETSTPAGQKSDVTYEHAVAIAQQVMQNLARQGRARLRTQPLQLSAPHDVCYADDLDVDPCLTAAPNNGANSSNLCRDNPTALAWTGCAGDCDLLLCSANLAALQSPLSDGRMGKILTHELSHAYGLAHVTVTDPVTFVVTPKCAGSDGCDGELMCEAVPNIAAGFLTNGDARGLRAHTFWGSENYERRKVFAGSRPEASGPLTVAALSTRLATHAPRIDCSTFSGADQCVAVIPSASGATGTTEVVALNQWTAAGWGAITSLVSSNAAHQLQPDIAIEPAGAEIYVVTVSQTNNVTWVWHINPVTHVITTKSLGYKSAVAPRVFFDDDINDAVVVGLERTPGNRPLWRADRIAFNASTQVLTATVLPSFGAAANAGGEAVASDFDVSCRIQVVGTTQCVLVAVLYKDGSLTGDVASGEIYSRSFSISTTSGGTVTMANAWTRSVTDHRAQSVQGVALTSSRLVVSIGANVPTGGVSHNSTMLEFPGLDVGASPSLVLQHKSDAQACSNPTSTGGFTLGDMTPHGGVSVAFCPLCGTAGKLQSLHYGRREDGDDFCY